ncbi:hypothetical protein [Massilia sp. ST3]|uniref:hypothetical protein n=1 Tax=Massilia sp. ST3 TaxID=2824903 RepID=UPI001B833992|nr:hypothetical protein [Massilia sp. ST3]MBQ5949492.1 hypothetical protein [Massilia sp. ST3]
MWKRVLSSLFAAAASLAAPLQAQDWRTFSYTGFLDQETGRFDPIMRLDGAFRGSDGNRNGMLELAELDGFFWNGYDYFSRPEGGCYGARCELKQFNYALGSGELFMDVEWGYSDEATIASSKTITGLSHVERGETGFRPPFFTYEDTWLWTEQTSFAVVPPPVSEPPFAAMLAAGLLLAAAGARQKRVSSVTRAIVVPG